MAAKSGVHLVPMEIFITQHKNQLPNLAACCYLSKIVTYCIRVLHETYDHWSVAVLTVTVHLIYSNF